MIAAPAEAGPWIGLFFLVSIAGETRRLDSKIPFSEVPVRVSQIPGQ